MAKDPLKKKTKFLESLNMLFHFVSVAYCNVAELSAYMGGAWFVRSTPERAVWVRALGL